ncbi:MAG: TMEM143 family protein, partial [Acidimicrobiales bacterium]
MEQRERFVPRRVGKLTNELVALPWADADSAEAFRSSARLVSALYHFEFHDREQAVVDAWEAAEGDPDAVAVVTDELRSLLDHANYVEVTMEELDDAMTREALIPLRLEVDVDEYEELLVFRRGTRREDVEISRWKGLRTEERTITVEDRVVVLTQVKPQGWFDERGIDPADRNLHPGQVSLKEFKDVPRADIEMLLPSTRIRFRPIDAVLVGLPAVLSGIAVLATKLLPTLGLIFVLAGAWLGVRDEEPELDQGALVALLGGLIAVGGFLLRQWTKLKSRRLKYMKTLSETLYFRTVADGPGVLHMLLSSAEQQEVVEVLLAHRFLLASPEGRTAEELDHDVESWIRETCHHDVDFEIADALDKVRELDLVEDGPLLRARPLPDALARLDRRWDDLFRHQ